MAYVDTTNGNGVRYFTLAIAFLDRFYQAIFFKYEDLEIQWKVKDEKAID